MFNISRIALRLRDQLQEFLGKLSLPKPARRFVLEAVYGIQTRQSLRLTEIARSLEEPIPLIKTVNRLSRQAGREGLAEALTRFVIKQGASRIGERTLLVIAPSDITKKYARKMEHLARVHDGSTGGITNGYWLCEVVGVECGGNEITPLAQHLWSQKAPDFVSENEEILGLVDRVSQACKKRDVWVMDRGGDRVKLLKPLLDRDLDFIIRQRGDRQTLWWVAEAYLTRWRIEETIRFSKQAYAIEDVRVLGYHSLRNLMALALVAMYFSMVHLGARKKLAVLCHHAIRAGKRLFGVPDFRYYTIADGICEIFGRSQVRPFPQSTEDGPACAQLDFLDLVDT